MDKYILFMGDIYYPSGGWEDFSGYFETMEDAIKFIESKDPGCLWAHIVYQDKIILEAIRMGYWQSQYWEFDPKL